MIRISKILLVAFVIVLLSLSFQASAHGDVLPAAVSSIAHGAHIRPTLLYGQEILNFNSLVQKNLAVVMYFLDWSGGGGVNKFDPYLLNRIQDTFPTGGPVIMLTWQPMNGRDAYGCDRDYSGGIPITRITAGYCDEYIAGFADELDARPERILLRFAHEMNIEDSPWHPGNYDLDASAYVAMYRHVYEVFNAQNVDNVEWMWSPNSGSYPDEPWNDMHNYYPGDGYVDWIGISGYNWYNASTSIQPWITFDDIYDEVLRDLTCHYAKPQMIAEVGTVEGSGALSKSSWILDAYEQAPNHPFLRGIVWFNDYAYADRNQADFRVTTGTADYGSVVPLPIGTGTITAAYRQAISPSIYTSTLPSLANVTPASVICFNQQVFLPIAVR